MQTTFDVIVLGAGPGGEVLSGRLADNGMSVALVERELVGGECSFYACMPSKALLRPGELLGEVGRVPGVREVVRGTIDSGAVLKRRDEVIHDLDDSVQLPWVQDKGIALFRGTGVLDGEKRLRVTMNENGEEHVLTAKRAIVLATGSGAAMPPIDGLADARPWTNREVTTTETIPGRLLILGGGVVGVEMAQAYTSLGAKVIVVEGADRILEHAEPIASEVVTGALEEAGAEIVCGVRATAASRDHASGEVTLTVEDGRTFTGDELLVAVGRIPRSEGLGLDSVGVQTSEHGYVEVDDHLSVGGSDWLFAIGDLNGRVLVTHAAKYQAHVLADRLLGRANGSAVADTFGCPQVVFCDPEVAYTGLTLAAAEEQFGAEHVIAIDLDTNRTPGASFYGRESPGKSRFVVDTDREVLVGATFVGFEVAEWIQAASIAVIGQVSMHRLAHTILPFPSRSELWLQFFDAYEKQVGHSIYDQTPDLLPLQKGTS